MSWTPPTPAERRDMWNERYRADPDVFGQAPNRFVAERLSGLQPSRVLDLGAGQGRNALWLATQGHDVTAVDLSDVAVNRLEVVAAEHELAVTAIDADLLDWRPEPACYDLVLLSYLQLIPEQRALVHGKAVEALASGGRVFLIAHHLDNLADGIGGPQIPEVLFTEEQLRGDFGSLRIDVLEKVRRPVDSDGVTGTAIDVLLDAVRPVGKDAQRVPIRSSGQ